MLSRFGYLLVLVCAAAVFMPGAASADVSHGMKIDWSFPDGPVRTHSDLAFWGNIMVAGNYDGFRVFDLSQTGVNRLLVSYLCRGPQNDSSLWGYNNKLYLFQSVDTPQTNGTTVCSQNRSSDTSACGPACFEGIRIFDLTNPAAPVYIKGVYTDCGSHTHTLVPDLANNRLLLYVSSYPGSSGPNCPSPFRKFSIVQVPLDAPETASVLSQPPVNGGPPGCHDMTAFLQINKMAAMCATEGQIWDITDPANPDTTHPLRIDDAGVNYWHSAEFTWDGQYVVTNDESFTGTCQPSNDGKIRIWRVSDGQLMSSFMIPRPQGSTYCSVHNGNIIPVVGRYLLVAAWYGGGTSVVDFTDPTNPREIAFYVGTGTSRQRADTWSSYWYNGKIYANDISRGIDVFDLVLPNTPYGYPWAHLNPQTQEIMYPPPIGPMSALARLTSAPAP
ncbi:MAG: hypothetical protein ABI896_07195 [Actinomycetota bacterium]